MLEDKPAVPFGGKTVLIGGDMAQILPVMKSVYAGGLVDHSIVSYEHWHQRRPFTLTQNMRAAADPDFADWVAQVRDGRANISHNEIIVPDRMLIKPMPRGKRANMIRQKDPTEEELLMDALIDFVFGGMTEPEIEKGVILAPVNDVVRKINTKILNRMTGQCIPQFAITTAIVEGEDVGDTAGFIVTQDELNAASPSNLPPQNLMLKKGCVVMLLLNLNKKQGLCNGTRFTVTQIGRHVLKLKRLITFNGRLDEVFLPKMKMRSDEVAIAGAIERYQYPVCLAAAITINKSQGQTIERVGLFLQKPVFSPGQFYVAVSRARNSANLRIAVQNGPQQGNRNLRGGRSKQQNVVTRNIVIPSILDETQ